MKRQPTHKDLQDTSKFCKKVDSESLLVIRYKSSKIKADGILKRHRPEFSLFCYNERIQNPLNRKEKQAMALCVIVITVQEHCAETSFPF